MATSAATVPALRLFIVDPPAAQEPHLYDNEDADHDEEQPRRGFGLVTMKDRAEALGGKLHIDSRRGAGTKVELEL